jgi:hypothetical protein
VQQIVQETLSGKPITKKRADVVAHCHTMEIIWKFLKKLKIELPCNPLTTDVYIYEGM